MTALKEIEIIEPQLHNSSEVRAIPIESDDDLHADAALRRQRLEHSLDMLESMQKNFRRGRKVLEPYFDSAHQAFQRLESLDPSVIANEDERAQMLETCDAMERLMRMWEHSRSDAGPHGI